MMLSFMLLSAMRTNSGAVLGYGGYISEMKLRLVESGMQEFSFFVIYFAT